MLLGKSPLGLEEGVSIKLRSGPIEIGGVLILVLWMQYWFHKICWKYSIISNFLQQLCTIGIPAPILLDVWEMFSVDTTVLEMDVGSLYVEKCV